MVHCKCMPYISLQVNISVLGWARGGEGVDDSGHGARNCHSQGAWVHQFECDLRMKRNGFVQRISCAQRRGGEVLKYNIFDREVWNPFLHFLHRVSSNNIESVSMCRCKQHG